MRTHASKSLGEGPLGGDARRELRIAEITSTIVDVPTVRVHELSSLSVRAQS